MLPNEAWQIIVSNIGDKKWEIQTVPSLGEMPQWFLVQMYHQCFRISPTMRMGSAKMDAPFNIRKAQFDYVYPLFFKKDRFAAEFDDIRFNEKYIFGIMQKFLFKGTTGLSLSQEDIDNYSEDEGPKDTGDSMNDNNMGPDGFFR